MCCVFVVFWKVKCVKKVGLNMGGRNLCSVVGYFIIWEVV